MGKTTKSNPKNSILLNVFTGSLGGLTIGIISNNVAYALSAGAVGGLAGLARHFILDRLGYKIVKKNKQEKKKFMW